MMFTHNQMIKGIMDRDIILEKINNIQRYLTTIHNATHGNADSLNDAIIQDAVLFNIQRSIQACIDISCALGANFKWGLPSSYKRCFLILHNHHVLSEQLLKKTLKMANFYYIAVHEYQKLDIHILKAIVQNHLGDFEDFYTAVLNYLNKVSTR